jgi:signal transduction histidine kinase/CheY-like chemotaxis protein
MNSLGEYSGFSIFLNGLFGPKISGNRLAKNLRASLFISLMLGLSSQVLAWQIDSEAGQIPIRIFTPADHNGAPFSTEIAEDAKGYIYVANEAGTLCFDGKSWTVLPKTGYSSFTTAVHIDRDERIWVAGVDHLGFYEADAQGDLKFVDQTEPFLNLLGGDNFGLIWEIHSDGLTHYFITSFQVVFWDGTQWSRHDFEVARRILPSWVDDQLHLHVRGDGIYRFNHTGAEKLLPEQDEISSGVMTILKDKAGNYLFGTLERGFWRLIGDRLEKHFSDTVFEGQLYDFVELDERLKLLAKSDGLYLFSHAEGIRRISEESIHNADRLFQSRSGAVWLTSETLIAEIHPTSYTYFGIAAWNLERNEDKLFAASNAALYRIDREATKPIGAGWISNPISVEDRLIFRKDNTLESWQGGEIERSSLIERAGFFLAESVWHEDVFYSMDEPEVSRWRVGPKGPTRINQTSETNLIISTVAEASPNSSLYAGYNNEVGLISWPAREARRKTPTVEDLSSHPSLPDGLKYLKAIQLGKRALVASDRGLFEYQVDSGIFEPLNLLGGEIGESWADFVYRNTSDGKGAILYIKDRAHRAGYRLGALRYRKGTGYEWKPFKLSGLSRAGTVRNLFHERRNGREILWVGGTSDLLRYDITDLTPPETLVANITLVQDLVTDHRFYGGFGSLRQGSTWKYPVKSLKFEFASPPAGLMTLGFETRLVGFSERWSAPSELAFREFNNLHEGDYAFEVRVVDEFGRTGPVTRLSFTILPPWYRTSYAYAGYILFALFAVLGSARLWTIRLQHRNTELESMVTQRTGELERSNRNLRQANAVKQNFLAGMSHEIRNPLNGILGITRMLKDESESKSDAERIEHLDVCASHLHGLLGQILDYSSLEAGKLEPRPEPVELPRLLDDVVRIHALLAERKQLKLELHCDLPEQTHISDPVLLRQILINLVSNAVKYTPKGDIRLAATAEPKGAVDAIRITVEDTGPGIPREKQGLVFEDFTRLSQPGESKVNGTGLGLAIARQMSQLLACRLSIDPDYTSGARFILELELKRGAAISKSTDAKQRPETVRLENVRVLVADDLDFNRFVTSRLLERTGAVCDEVEDGRSALEALEKNHYDLAVLDVNMPLLSGIEVVSSFLAQKPVRPPLFIALSGQVSVKIESECYRVGFSHFLEKPLEPDTLFRICHAHFEASADTAAPFTGELLDYLAGGDEDSRKALRNRFADSVRREFDELGSALERGEAAAASATVHKLRGLINLERSNDQIELLKLISKQIQDGDLKGALETLRGA